MKSSMILKKLIKRSHWFKTWEVVDIEEEGETGNVVKSAIHVPAHPTPVLTQVLAHLCSSINSVAAHTITR